MKNNNDLPFYEFWADTFHFTIDENRYAYKALYELISDTEFLKAYFLEKDDEFKGKVEEDELPDEFKKQLRVINVLSKRKGLTDATIIFNRQTLVVLVTIIESMLDEFFLCLFCSSPEKMYDYIQADDESKLKGKVDIKDIINSTSRSELLYSLAKQAASRAMQGEFKSALKRLKKLTIGDDFSKDLLDKITELNETRNKIIHELNEIEIQFDDINNAFETTFELVEYLEKIAKQLKIPVAEISPEKEEVS